MENQPVRGPERDPRQYDLETLDAIQAQEASLHRQHAELYEFHDMLMRLTPRVFVTRVIVALNVLVFVVMLVRGVSLTAPTGTEMIAWGANYGPETLDGQWWRLLTSTFLHFGIIHIGMNMWALWQAGFMLERLTGNLGFLVAYLLAGLFGSMASVLLNPVVVSAGASGAVFGVFGALLGFVLRRRDIVPATLFAAMKQSCGAFLVYNLAFSVMIPGIDLWAHAGGAVAGFLAGILLSGRRGSDLAQGRIRRGLLTATSGGLILAGMIFLAPPPPVDLQELVDNTVELVEQTNQKLARITREVETGKIAPADTAQAVNNMAEQWRAIQAQWQHAQQVSHNPRVLISTHAEYVEARLQNLQRLEEALREDSPEKYQRAVLELKSIEQKFTKRFPLIDP